MRRSSHVCHRGCASCSRSSSAPSPPTNRLISKSIRARAAGAPWRSFVSRHPNPRSRILCCHGGKDHPGIAPSGSRDPPAALVTALIKRCASLTCPNTLRLTRHRFARARSRPSFSSASGSTSTPSSASCPSPPEERPSEVALPEIELPPDSNARIRTREDCECSGDQIEFLRFENRGRPTSVTLSPRKRIAGRRQPPTIACS